ncbi:acriflavin resistance protein [Acuticoccus sediminis]|uniref:Acriflavin resistance protein n=1 Tax=Acuticoccus sediminis TaxID=2184697 RepID=A0A8B2NZP0_9HYPH|nr:efflux RND transporter permease subunit [Acuticoccus sediminis]RAI04291.1 acriflavin resistance protein [Acuticoccus sediminis]
MIDAFYRIPRLTVLAIMVVMALGIIAVELVGRQEDPAFLKVVGFVMTEQPGADAQRVEAEVTEPIERRISEIEQVDIVRSVSRPGLSTVIVELRWDLGEAQIADAWSKVRDAIKELTPQMPSDASPPVFDDTRSGAYTGISALMPADPSVPLSVTTRYAEALRERLQNVAGTKQVRLYGDPEEEVLVAIDPAELANFGWTPSQVAAAIGAADPRADAGRSVGPAGDLIVEIGGAIDDLERIRNIRLAATPDGGSVRVGDIATVTRSEHEPPYAIAMARGKRAILVAVMMEDGLKADRYMREISAAMDAFDKDLPGGLTHVRLFDQSEYTVARLTDLASRLAAGFGLVVVVLFFTLGLRPALVVGIALPLVSMATMATLPLMGISIEQMSVAGLIIGLGMLVDAAIVVVDDIRRRFVEGQDRGHEVRSAVSRLAAPLAASTATTVLAFMPMALLGGPTGDFLGPVARVVVVMLIWSFVIALTLTAALAGWMLHQEPRRSAIGLLTGGIQVGRFGDLFRRTLVIALRRPRITVMYGMVLPVAGFLLLPTLVEQFFPPVERDQFFIEIEVTPGAGIAATQAAARQIDTVLGADPRIRNRIWALGRSAPPFYYNMLDNRERVPEFGVALITATSAEAAETLIPELQQRFDREMLDARVLVRELVQGPPVIAPVELRITGPDLATLKSLGEAALAPLSTLPGITHVRTSINGGPPKMQFVLDEAKVLAAGLTLDGVAAELQAALAGQTGATLIEGTERLPIRVRMAADARGDLAVLQTLRLVNDKGDAVPMAALGTLKVVPTTTQITRHAMERVNTLEMFPRTGVLPQSVVDAARRKLDEAGFVLPHGYRFVVGGDHDARERTIEALSRPFAVLLALAGATFVLTFNSFRLAVAAAFACILFAGLSLLSVAAAGYALGIAVLVGIIGSIGVSINDTIIVLSALQIDPRARRGDVEAAADTVMESGRHVLSTTITTMVGFFPLAIGGGGFWPAFSVAVVGGVALSTIITLYLAPALFFLVYARPEEEEAAPPVQPVPPPASLPTPAE